ncbi:hypothetical protein GY21_15660 [Cryobacterium roopkundense]|uniref:Putative glutamate--cysteine ligase 2 n=1 Tax=Cryobacterium roopkundense TaxID=1001240 RepID=A0A099J2V4_9MICO|nr:glutamate--cysteine ligase [Cryobacterium roopkundense]KGJ72400.1 hypothetical protein GY21_15660 [Cryobacterium roopkundense]MBB5640763.1 carboxylate-amine ligase [Cryobacterium roopkundense]
MRTFGLEEEFMFLDRVQLRPLNVGSQVLARLRGTPRPSHFVHREFLASQIERSSPVFTHLAQAEADLLTFRSRLAAAATEYQAVAAGVGTPFQAEGWPEITETARYHRVGEEFRGLVPDHLINGLHVHVGIPNREAGVQTLNRIRVWLPTLLALSVNSPFWQGRDTGFSSWRSLHARRWPTAGCPPPTTAAADYDSRTRRLVGVGGTYDLHTIWWSARLAERYPTVEVRVCDAQLDAAGTLLLTALIRALVSTALADAERGTPPIHVDQELLDASLWHAARDGVRDGLLNPVTGALEPAANVVAALLHTVDHALDQAGDGDRVRVLLERLRRLGSGAQRQRAALHEGGRAGLVALFERSATAHC